MCELNNCEKSSILFEKSEYTWIIRNNTEINSKHKSVLESPIFPGGEGKYKWKLKFYPSHRMKPNYASLNLSPVTKLRDTITVIFTFSLRDNKNIVRREVTQIIRNFSSYDICCMIPDGESMESIIENDILQIHAVVFAEASTLQAGSIGILDLTSYMKLSHDLEDIFTTSEFKDFTIKFNDKTEVTVHRNILAARSPVFAAMFRHDVSENKVGFTEIIDIDKATMMQLLTFIYTGKTKHLSQEEAINLLLAADKYDVADLIERCTEFVDGNITESSAMDVLILAEVHGVRKLKKAAFEFILTNPEKFSDQKCLEKLKKYPNLLIEFSSKMISMLCDKLGYSSTSMLPDANAQEQKRMLGERLFPIIHRWYPDLAGKITGMLLEIDNSELLHMLEHNKSLKSKVEEAVAVLHAHHARESLSATGWSHEKGIRTLSFI